MARVVVGSKNSYKYGYIDKKGAFVVQPQFDQITVFSEGLAPVRVGDKWGYIDKSGNRVIKLQFNEVKEFTEGLGAVRIGKKWGYISK